MKPFGKRIAMAVVCAATLTSPFFLSGCSMSELWQGTEQSRKEIAQRSEQDQVHDKALPMLAVGRAGRLAPTTAAQFRLLDQAFVLMLQQMGLNLSHGVHGHCDDDQD